MRIMFKKRKADAPIISTIMLMAITLFAMSITLSYVNNTLTRRQGENDFESAKIFMKNMGLQIDDVAWTKGRVDTVHFTSQYGQAEYVEDAILYTIEYYKTGNPLPVDVRQYYSSIFMFNIPLDKYSLDELYYESLLPSPSTSLSLAFYGSRAPTARVFVKQKSSVGNNDFLRIVVVPVLRYRDYAISIPDSTERYVRVYLPELQQGSASPLAKSVVLSGQSISTDTHSDISRIIVRVSFPKEDLLYNEDFFQLQGISEQVIDFPGASTVETYIGGVKIDYGA